MTRPKGSRTGGRGSDQPELGQPAGGSAMCMESAHKACSLRSHIRASSEQSGPQAPQQRAGSALRVGFIPACLPPCPRFQLLGKVGQGIKKQKALYSPPSSCVFIPRFLSIRVLSLFLSCTACCLPGSLLPPLSAKCQSSYRMSSSALHPRRLCPRT